MDSDVVLGLTHDLFQVMKQFPRMRLIRGEHGGFRRREYDVLVLLVFTLNEGIETLTVTELSELLKITPAGVTHLLNPLADQGCIERSRNPDDRREVLIRLTEKGRTIAEGIIAAAQSRLIGLVEYLGEEDSATLIRLMSKMIEFFSAQ